MSDVRREIKFLLNGREVSLNTVGASETLLDYLRLSRRLTGTKEGCAEGDCGACTVLVGRILDGGLRYEPVNACIRFLASLDGCHVVTIEHLRSADGTLHPVQKAMVEHHASQCGFCTPGIVMSLYGLWMGNATPNITEVETALQGNLCRCTGYEPIITAAMSVNEFGSPTHDALIVERAEITAKLSNLRDGSRVEISAVDGGDLAILPASVDDLAAVLMANPDATIIAGATDVGLWVTKFLRPVSPAVFIGHLDGLKTIKSGDDGLHIGAGVTYSEAEADLIAMFPHLAEYWKRIAGWQVRNMGTIGGNIANGSPIGDTPPVLIALGASVVLRQGGARREVPLETFFVDYGKQDRTPGDFVEMIHIPLSQPGTRHAAYKISKRRDEDISSVAAGFSITVEGGIIRAARIAFGGMAATPKRATAAEAAMIGLPFSEATLRIGAAKMPDDFAPLTDWRASSQYRMTVSQNLFRRFWAEHGPERGPEHGAVREQGEMVRLAPRITPDLSRGEIA